MAETRSQLLRRAEALPEDDSYVLHRFPDGGTLRRILTRGALHREGAIMRNCWQTALHLVPEARRERWLEVRVGAEPYCSLRDAENVPLVSFFLYRVEDARDILANYLLEPPEYAYVVDQAEQARSKPLTAEHLGYFKRWAETVELPVFIQYYDKDEDLNEIDTLNSAAAALWANEWSNQSDIAA
jgi:hypothetical protein